MNDGYEIVDCTKWLNHELCEIERKKFLAIKYNKAAFERTAERNFVHSVDSTCQNYLKKMKGMKANDNL